MDPATLELEHRFEEMEAAAADELLATPARGELIDTEIEIRSGRGETFAEAAEAQREHRNRLFAPPRGWAWPRRDGHPSLGQLPRAAHHRHRALPPPAEELRWVAQRNNTWSLHVHVGVRGADRAVAVCDWMRELLPPLLALSANSLFLDHRDTGLHSVRTEIFTRVFPRCGVHEPFGDWGTYADFVARWRAPARSSRPRSSGGACGPHHSFGPSRCGSATRRPAATSRSPRRDDARVRRRPRSTSTSAATPRSVPSRCAGGRSEATSGAIRWGLDGEMIDFRRGQVIPTRVVLEEIAEWTEPARRRSASRWTSRRPTAPSARALGRRGAADRGDLPALDRRDPRDLRAVFGRGRG